MPMARIFVSDFGNDPDAAETKDGKPLVHYRQAFLIGNGTLCGHTDRTRWSFEETTRRVNCPGCIAIVNYVRGKSDA